MNIQDFKDEVYEIIVGIEIRGGNEAIFMTKKSNGKQVTLFVKAPSKELLASLENSSFGFFTNVKGSVKETTPPSGENIEVTSYQFSQEKPERPFYKNPAHKPYNHAKPHR